ncbi:hypothetical protein LIER_08317 [Lithospermum erythrorhizon]|uniref:Reverse transcriptase/retrotransposon-derived protein RNase H-like domain-containing protein n=1 Tax=Lithospermum erythrorhizon TaxID=34254 RepID=A0AAV3PFG0_LITER
MLVKSKRRGDHLRKLEESLGRLKECKLRINLGKCSFGVTSGKFLDFMISERGIETNPDKIEALLSMEPPRSYKDVQKLTGRLAALSRVISKSGDRNYLFFKKLRQAAKEEFVWDSQCDAAFKELKQYLGSSKLLTRPEESKELQLYLVVSEGAVSSVLL